MTNRKWLCGITLAALALFPARAFAEQAETEEERENREAAEEVKAEQEKMGTDEVPATVLKGKIFLSPPAGEDPTKKPIGTFTTESGASLQVKVLNLYVKNELMNYNGKAVKLAGRIRNKSKYFIVEEVLRPDSAGGQGGRVRKRGGF